MMPQEGKRSKYFVSVWQIAEGDLSNSAREAKGKDEVWKKLHDNEIMLMNSEMQGCKSTEYFLKFVRMNVKLFWVPPEKDERLGCLRLTVELIKS